MKFSSEYGFSVIKIAFAHGEGSIYFMFHQKYIPFQEYETSRQKDEYEFLYEKDGELKGNENESKIGYGIGFIKCNLISA